MATIVMDTSLDVIDKYKELIEEMTSEGSLYIKMKETLIDLLDAGEIKGPDRARVVAETISQMSASLSGQAITNALQWTAQEKELYLKKAELELRLDVLANEVLKSEKDVEVSEESKRLAQAKRIREYGNATLDLNGNVTSLSDSGLIYQQQKQVEKQIEIGTATLTKMADDLLTAAKQRLSIEKQTELYERQKQGFDDNKYQKLFDSQINAWGLMFSSGMLTEKPSIITSDKVSQLYAELTSSL